MRTVAHRTVVTGGFINGPAPRRYRSALVRTGHEAGALHCVRRAGAWWFVAAEGVGW